MNWVANGLILGTLVPAVYNAAAAMVSFSFIATLWLMFYWILEFFQKRSLFRWESYLGLLANIAAVANFVCLLIAVVAFGVNFPILLFDGANLGNGVNLFGSMQQPDGMGGIMTNVWASPGWIIGCFTLGIIFVNMILIYSL